jgi:pimeloyl-ACP methyl ester carboxylesterase
MNEDMNLDGDMSGAMGRIRGLGTELATLAGIVGALPWRSLGGDTLDAPDAHPVPVVLVHGFLGDATNFAALRRHLGRRGIRRFSSFAYRPRLDYQRLATELDAHVRAVRQTTGAPQVDVVAHSLGGLVARYFVQLGGAPLVRRLVTLGTPYLAYTNPAQELAIFGEHDAIVPPPIDRARRRMAVIPACGHLSLLADGRALAAVARHLRRPLALAGRVADLAA